MGGQIPLGPKALRAWSLMSASGRQKRCRLGNQVWGPQSAGCGSWRAVRAGWVRSRLQMVQHWPCDAKSPLSWPTLVYKEQFSGPQLQPSGLPKTCS
eukprot:1150431-Pelagomonas_calceolata.AAC.1